MKKIFLVLFILFPTLVFGQSVLDGRLPAGRGQFRIGGVTGDITTTSLTDIIAAPAANQVYYITMFIVSNTNAITTSRVDLYDGASATSVQCPAGAVGGGCVIKLDPPLPMTSNLAVRCQSSAAATIRCSALGVGVQF